MGAAKEIWAWDGTIWRKVLIDAAGNLQVDVLTAPQNNVYGRDIPGVVWRPLEVQVIGGYHAWTHYGLIVSAMQYQWDASTSGFLPAPYHVTTTRLVGAGQVKASAGMLHWLACNPAAGNSVFELSDDLDGLGVTVMDCFSTAREGKGFAFNPPMEFATGIRLKTFTNMTSCVFGYI